MTNHQFPNNRQSTNTYQEADVKSLACLEDGPQNNVSFHRRLRRLIPRFVLSWLATSPRLQALLIEIRSLRWRMELQSNLQTGATNPRKGSLVVDLGPALERDASGCLVPCRRTRARMKDIERFASICPKATLFEEWVFLQGWDRGEESARLGTLGSDIVKTDAAVRL